MGGVITRVGGGPPSLLHAQPSHIPLTRASKGRTLYSTKPGLGGTEDGEPLGASLTFQKRGHLFQDHFYPSTSYQKLGDLTEKGGGEGILVLHCTW